MYMIPLYLRSGPKCSQIPKFWPLSGLHWPISWRPRPKFEFAGDTHHIYHIPKIKGLRQIVFLSYRAAKKISAAAAWPAWILSIPDFVWGYNYRLQHSYGDLSFDTLFVKIHTAVEWAVEIKGGADGRTDRTEHSYIPLQLSLRRGIKTYFYIDISETTNKQETFIIVL